MAAESTIFQVLISLAVLLFAAKLMAKLMQKVKQSTVLGEIIAGIIISPFALGGLPLPGAHQLVVLDETILYIGEISAIIILFVAGMGITPREFMKLGAPSFTVGALGVITPFFVGYFVFTAIMGVEVLPAIIVATALTATSIAISVQVLQELGRLHSREGRIILGAAVADDVLGIAVLSVVLTMVRTGNVSLEITGVIALLLQILGIYAAILLASVLVVPRFLNSRIWKPQGSTEAAATASCFAISGAAAFVGLSPIVGAFAAGMAVTASKTFHQIKGYAEKLDVMFAPLFFAIIGARVDLRGVLNSEVLVLAAIIIAVAVATKLVGCGFPSIIFLKNTRKAMKVGIGMISRGEVGLIVAAAGASAGVLSGTLYSVVVIMVAVSTIITPVWLKAAYGKEPAEPETTVMEKEETK